MLLRVIGAGLCALAAYAPVTLRYEPVSGDYFRRSAYVAEVRERPARDVWLTLEYEDRGCGLISVSVPVARAR